MALILVGRGFALSATFRTGGWARPPAVSGKCPSPAVACGHGTRTCEDCCRRAAGGCHPRRPGVDGECGTAAMVRTRQLVGGGAADAAGTQPGGRRGVAGADQTPGGSPGGGDPQWESPRRALGGGG